MLNGFDWLGLCPTKFFGPCDWFENCNFYPIIHIEQKLIVGSRTIFCCLNIVDVISTKVGQRFYCHEYYYFNW